MSEHEHLVIFIVLSAGEMFHVLRACQSRRLCGAESLMKQPTDSEHRNDFKQQDTVTNNLRRCFE